MPVTRAASTGAPAKRVSPRRRGAAAATDHHATFTSPASTKTRGSSRASSGKALKSGTPASATMHRKPTTATTTASATLSSDTPSKHASPPTIAPSASALSYACKFTAPIVEDSEPEDVDEHKDGQVTRAVSDRVRNSDAGSIGVSSAGEAGDDSNRHNSNLQQPKAEKQHSHHHYHHDWEANKENIAPQRRALSRSDREREASTQQAEGVARRTRSSQQQHHHQLDGESHSTAATGTAITVNMTDAPEDDDARSTVSSLTARRTRSQYEADRDHDFSDTASIVSCSTSTTATMTTRSTRRVVKLPASSAPTINFRHTVLSSSSSSSASDTTTAMMATRKRRRDAPESSGSKASSSDNGAGSVNLAPSSRVRVAMARSISNNSSVSTSSPSSSSSASSCSSSANVLATPQASKRSSGRLGSAGVTANGSTRRSSKTSRVSTLSPLGFHSRASSLVPASMATSSDGDMVCNNNNDNNDEDNDNDDASSSCCCFSSQASAITSVSSLFESQLSRGSAATLMTAPSSLASSPARRHHHHHHHQHVLASPISSAEMGVGVEAHESVMDADTDIDMDACTTVDLDGFHIGGGTQQAASGDDYTSSALPASAAAVVCAPKQHTNVYAHARTLLRYATMQDGNETLLPQAQALSQDQDAFGGCVGSRLPFGKTGATTQIVGRQRERAQVAAFLADRFPQLDTSTLQVPGVAAPPAVCSQSVAALSASNKVAADTAVAVVKRHANGALYICGTPGTGKTALLKDMLASLKSVNDGGEDEKRLNVAYINCVAVSQPKDIFRKLLAALGHGQTQDKDAGDDVQQEQEQQETDSGDEEQRLAAMLRSPATNSIVVLDEIDSLLESSVHQSILYRIFMLASAGAVTSQQRNCNATAIIGIANSLDLTDKFLPLLASQGRSPALVNFQPFGTDEIIAIVKARLEALHPRYDLDYLPGFVQQQMNIDMDADSAFGVSPLDPAAATTSASASATATNDDIPILMPAALKLAAMKVAAVTGDIRKALDVCRLAIELVEMEQRAKAVQAVAAECSGAAANGTNGISSNVPTDSPQRLLAAWTPLSAPKVTPQHVLKVLSSVIGSTSLNRIRTLPLHAKLLLAAHYIALQRLHSGLSECSSANARSSSGVSVIELQENYERMLHHDGAFSALEPSEVLDVLESMETQGLVELSGPVGARGTGAGGRSISQAAKRCGKRQLLTGHRIVYVRIATQDVKKALTTAAPASSSAEHSTSAAATEALKRILGSEELRIARCKGWEEVARQQEEVRANELGGGRMAHAQGL
ncbi:P-loop containing nucleoside triphosphate hydrolase protein [Tilletiaria anomala UBC 951]|uniref:p-loop containing nucleoside triphosphate hydrolase protein n=1 Tax=Tilletiaria anomala (strain ATCC 24038 / CBS 436.72 / UBC 951) TaxID=1037660 RepID=A0A066WIZ4_TILAU|nr:P-loop containing nucleoside triphosphate hydrolase protein [Tilletiaria anomala UBC 951]KDN52523.1 P-loop containing nucleoside triphosphate hydrolase protein [Tilletiaria anomala UBC 951]